MSLLRKVSIKDIAEAAGVSVTLVSFVLNGKASEYRINEDTAKRIIDIANKLRYKPNLAAQSLREGRSHIIGIVLSDISNPFFSSLARLFEDISSNYDYTVFFGSSDERPERMKKIVGNLINRGVDGLIVVPCENTKNFLTNLSNHSVPIVLLDRYFADSNIKFVGLNNFAATYEATKYLIEHHHQRPTIVAYDINLIHMQERIRGYVEAMKDFHKENFIKVYYLPQHSQNEIANQIIQGALKDHIDSFIFATNLISLSCLYAIKKLDEQVANQLGIVGFDGNPAFDFLGRSISYIQQPLDKMAKSTFSILINEIAKKPSESVLIDGDFVIIGEEQ